MNRPTAVIAEDEPLLRENGVQAIRALEAHEPDVLFLDIQMPGMTGLDVARVASGKCHVVFVTAYDHYAVAAFEQGAVDYVMKPFSAARLATAVGRVRERMKGAPANLEGILKTLAERSGRAGQFLRWISVGEGKTIRLITIDEVCYFQADNKYTTVVTASTRSLINKTIKELVDELDPDVFFQIHRSTIVNLNAIAAVHRHLRGRMEIRLKQRKETLPVSASFTHLFRQM